MPATVAKVIRGEDNWCLWKNDRMLGVDGVFAPFCFPFLVMVKGTSGSKSIFVARAFAEDVGQGTAPALASWAMVVGTDVIDYPRECTEKWIWEQQETHRKFKGIVVVEYRSIRKWVSYLSHEIMSM